MELQELIARAIKESGLLGCDCCVDSHAEVYENDSCDVDNDGWKDHAYTGRCAAITDRSELLAGLIVKAVVF